MLPLEKIEKHKSHVVKDKFPLLFCDHTKKTFIVNTSIDDSSKVKIWQSDYCVRVNFVSSFNQFIDSLNVSYCMFDLLKKIEHCILVKIVRFYKRINAFC